MDYEKKYKSLVEAVKTLKEANPSDDGIQNWVNDNVPELIESEDERIKKSLTAFFAKFKPDDMWDADFSFGDIVAWFEKLSGNNLIMAKSPQLGEQKPTNKVEPKDYSSIDPHFFKPADKIEPKFHEGDWIVHHGTENIYQVVARIDNQYQLKYGDNYTIQNCVDVDRCARLWDITRDAKNGDVLAAEEDGETWIGIFKELDADNTQFFSSYCQLPFGGSEIEINIDTLYSEGCHPATKEQRDALMKAMADAGYTFNFEKKELEKIEDEEYDGEDYGIDGLYHAQRILEKTLGEVDGYQSDDGILEHKCAISAVKELSKQQKSFWSEERIRKCQD